MEDELMSLYAPSLNIVETNKQISPGFHNKQRQK